MHGEKDKRAVNAADIAALLDKRFSPPEWMSLSELRNATGFRSKRTLDYFAVNTWPSKRAFVGVEIKISRADFRRELDQPGKRATFAECCTEFYFAAPRDVIPVEELPDGCGLLEPRGDKMVATRRAKQYPDRHPEEEMWVSIVRQCGEIRDRANQTSAPFATLSGREVSIDDLRRLVLKLRGIQGERGDFRRAYKHEIDAEVHKQRAESLAKWEAAESNLGILVGACQHLARSNGVRLHYRESVEELANHLRSLGDGVAVGTQIATIRSAAKTLEAAASALESIRPKQG